MGKNLIGAFHQPLTVISDINILNSLPKREFYAGLAEVVKYGLIKDIAFFEWLEKEYKEILCYHPSKNSDHYNKILSNQGGNCQR